VALLSNAERDYLNRHRLGRLATASATAQPHVVPVGYRLDPESDAFSIGQHSLEGRGQGRLYVRHIATNPRVALVVDDLQTTPTWLPSGVLVKGEATIHMEGGEGLGPGFGPHWVEIQPDWVSSWGVDTHAYTPATPRRA
jgi:pyridoxamine 5'-phosphate oxidase family protein